MTVAVILLEAVDWLGRGSCSPRALAASDRAGQGLESWACRKTRYVKTADDAHIA
jgi:hypothetical protein